MAECGDLVGREGRCRAVPRGVTAARTPVQSVAEVRPLDWPSVPTGQSNAQPSKSRPSIRPVRDDHWPSRHRHSSGWIARTIEDAAEWLRHEQSESSDLSAEAKWMAEPEPAAMLPLKKPPITTRSPPPTIRAPPSPFAELAVKVDRLKAVTPVPSTAAPPPDIAELLVTSQPLQLTREYPIFMPPPVLCPQRTRVRLPLMLVAAGPHVPATPPMQARERQPSLLSPTW